MLVLNRYAEKQSPQPATFTPWECCSITCCADTGLIDELQLRGWTLAGKYARRILKSRALLFFALSNLQAVQMRKQPSHQKLSAKRAEQGWQAYPMPIQPPHRTCAFACLQVMRSELGGRSWPRSGPGPCRRCSSNSDFRSIPLAPSLACPILVRSSRP